MSTDMNKEMTVTKADTSTVSMMTQQTQKEMINDLGEGDRAHSDHRNIYDLFLTDAVIIGLPCFIRVDTINASDPWSTIMCDHIDTSCYLDLASGYTVLNKGMSIKLPSGNMFPFMPSGGDVLPVISPTMKDIILPMLKGVIGKVHRGLLYCRNAYIHVPTDIYIPLWIQAIFEIMKQVVASPATYSSHPSPHTSPHPVTVSNSLRERLLLLVYSIVVLVKYDKSTKETILQNKDSRQREKKLYSNIALFLSDDNSVFTENLATSLYGMYELIHTEPQKENIFKQVSGFFRSIPYGKKFINTMDKNGIA
jgi:hypothetical protein